MPLGRKMTPKINEKPTHMEVNNLQRKASIPLCVSIVLDVKTGGSVPKICLQESTTLPNAKKKTLCRTPFLAYGILWRSPCHPAAAEGAKLSRMRRGRVQSCLERRARPVITFTQRHANAPRTKKMNAELNAQLIFFFSGSALHTLTPCLKG